MLLQVGSTIFLPRGGKGKRTEEVFVFLTANSPYSIKTHRTGLQTTETLQSGWVWDSVQRPSMQSIALAAYQEVDLFHGVHQTLCWIRSRTTSQDVFPASPLGNRPLASSEGAEEREVGHTHR